MSDVKLPPGWLEPRYRVHLIGAVACPYGRTLEATAHSQECDTATRTVETVDAAWGAYVAELERELESTKPEWDATDDAHPCWWRGHDNGAQGMERKLRAQLTEARAEVERARQDGRNDILLMFADTVAQLGVLPQDEMSAGLESFANAIAEARKA